MRHFFTTSALAVVCALAACADAPTRPGAAAPAALSVGSSSGGLGDGTGGTGEPGDPGDPGGPGGPVDPTTPVLPTPKYPLTVTSLHCEDSGGGSYAYTTTSCRGVVSGGTGGNTYHWNVITTSQSDGPTVSDMTGVCNRGTDLTVTFTVTDSSSATAAATTTFHCYWIVP